MAGCGACTAFEEDIFSLLVTDTEILSKMNLDEVTFGRDRHSNFVLETQYPDFNVTYAPYLWLSAPYDESTGYHLKLATMNDPNLNKRHNGAEFAFRRDTTYGDAKSWLLSQAALFAPANFKLKRSSRY